ncbi:MAG: hypothetical protein RL536_313 [Candidatus Parcubacteria bacterium]|jgi:hypothetical protein
MPNTSAPTCDHDPAFICAKCRYEVVRQKALLGDCRQPDYDELMCVLNAAIARTDYNEAGLVLTEFGRDFFDEELEDMIRIRIERGHYDLAHHAAEMARRVLSQEERDEAIKNELCLNDSTDVVRRAVGKGEISVETIQALFNICTVKALPNTAGILATRIGHVFTALDIYRLEESCRRLGFEHRLKDVYLSPVGGEETVPA